MGDDRDNGRRTNQWTDSALDAAKQFVLGQCVGYKGPPPHTRFVKGQSGNPDDRPHKQTVTAMTPDLTPSASRIPWRFCGCAGVGFRSQYPMTSTKPPPETAQH
jgi:hypothetical protein